MPPATRIQTGHLPRRNYDNLKLQIDSFSLSSPSSSSPRTPRTTTPSTTPSTNTNTSTSIPTPTTTLREAASPSRSKISKASNSGHKNPQSLLSPLTPSPSSSKIKAKNKTKTKTKTPSTPTLSSPFKAKPTASPPHHQPRTRKRSKNLPLLDNTMTSFPPPPSSSSSMPDIPNQPSPSSMIPEIIISPPPTQGSFLPLQFQRPIGRESAARFVVRGGSSSDPEDQVDGNSSFLVDGDDYDYDDDGRDDYPIESEVVDSSSGGGGFLRDTGPEHPQQHNNQPGYLSSPRRNSASDTRMMMMMMMDRAPFPDPASCSGLEAPREEVVDKQFLHVVAEQDEDGDELVSRQ